MGGLGINYPFKPTRGASPVHRGTVWRLVYRQRPADKYGAAVIKNHSNYIFRDPIWN